MVSVNKHKIISIKRQNYFRNKSKNLKTLQIKSTSKFLHTHTYTEAHLGYITEMIYMLFS